MYSLKVFIILFILSIYLVSTHEIYTRSQLRGLHQYYTNKAFNEEIQRIVDKVVELAKGDQTSYTLTYYVLSGRPDDLRYADFLSNFNDKAIITRLKNILIDSNVTISEPKCCSRIFPGCEQHEMNLCKFIEIKW
jgi:hypothetical protein